MLASASYKKVRTISEGNFHSCYASNKAEKFKFRRLSQGLESCAQAQALKLRKEQKELAKVFQHLQKEKDKHENEKAHQRYYLNLGQNSSEASLVNGSSFTTVIFSGSDEIQQNKRRKKYQTIKSFHGEFVDDAKSSKSRRRFSLPVKLQDNEEVIPFYMRHNYTHYHRNPYYDQLVQDQQAKSSNHVLNQSETEIPSWQKDSKLSRLKTQRNAIVAMNDEQLDFLRNVGGSAEMKESKESTLVVPSEKSMVKMTEKSPSNMDVAYQLKHFRRKLPDILCSSENQHSTSVLLTPLERQELAKHHRNARTFAPDPPFNEAERKLLSDQRNRSRQHIMSSSKASYLKNMLNKRLANGEDLNKLLDDEMFSDALEVMDDGRIYPAYNSGIDLTFEDFCALRKCKYLRVSDLNLKSLNEITISSLVEK